MPCCDVTVGHYYGQLMTAAHVSYATGQQLHGLLSMLDTAHCLEARRLACKRQRKSQRKQGIIQMTEKRYTASHTFRIRSYEF